MKRDWLKFTTILIAISFLVSLFAGCSANKTTESNSTSETAGTAKNNVELTYWVRFPTALVGIYNDYNETPFVKEMEKQTGIKVKYICPPVGQENEQFDLMVAAKDLPDMIERNFITFPGGPEKAINDGIIIKLNDAIDKYAPNLKNVLQKNPDVAKQIKTDSGTNYVFPGLEIDPYLRTSRGPMIRKDWLDDLGLKIPETIDEWYTVLKAFKTQKNASAPLSFLDSLLTQGYSFMGAYGVIRDYYLDNGKIKYGPIEPGYKDFLTTLNKWYQEGLLDPDFMAQDSKVLLSKITSGKTGATIDSCGSNMEKYIVALKKENSKYDIVSAPYPVLNKGEVPKFGHRLFEYIPGTSVAITTKSKNVEAASKWLDYHYGDKGHMLLNFGIEGESYVMENGYPRYTDIITKNKEGLTLAQSVSRYIRGSFNGPFDQDARYLEQYLNLPEQKEAINVWKRQDSSSYMPQVTPTSEESKKYSSIMSEVNTYVLEMYTKFIMGQEKISDFNKYVDNVKKTGIDSAIAIQQAALERYKKR